MVAAVQRPMDMAQFLAWEERQELRHEFDGTSVVAMTGGTAAHGSIISNLNAALNLRLRGTACRAYGSDMKIRLARSIRYPDAFVACSPVAPDDTFIADPVVVFEVLSKSTAGRDLGAKSAEYQSHPSIQRYVVLYQTHRAAQVFFRTGQGWEFETVDAKGAMDMPEIGIAVPLAEIYEGLTLRSDFATASSVAFITDQP